MNCLTIVQRSFQLAEPVLEEGVGAVEVGAQVSGSRRPVPARQRLLAGGVKELMVNAYEQPCSDAGVSLVDLQLRLEGRGQYLHEVRHHLAFLRLEGGGRFDDAGEGRESRAAQTRT